ncbi:MAG: YciI family protein [Mycobacterium sp.]
MFHVLTSTYLQPLDVVDQTRPAHLKFLAAEIEAGSLLVAGRQEDGSGGVLITTDMTTDEVQVLLDRDPYVQGGVASYDRRSFNGAYRAAGL